MGGERRFRTETRIVKIYRREIKRMKKIISILLALVMALSLCSAAWAVEPVAKIGETTYTSLEDAINAASDGATIILLANAEVTSGTLDKTVTIKSAGEAKYEIKGLKTIGGTNVTLENVYLNLTGTLDIGGTGTTLTNCTIRAKEVGYRDIVDGNTTAFTGGTPYNGATNNATYLTKVTGTNVIMTDCTIDGTDKDNSYFPNMCLAPVSGTNVTMTRCTFNEGFGACYYSTPNDTWTLDGCKFTNIYCYNIHAGDTAANIVVKNCQIAGWTSFGSDIASISFENCSFAKSSGYATVIAYKDVSFTNCTFTEDYTAGNEGLWIVGDAVIEMASCKVVAADGSESTTAAVTDLIKTDENTNNGFAAIDAAKDASGKYISGTFLGDAAAVGAAIAPGYESSSSGNIHTVTNNPVEYWNAFSNPTKKVSFATLAEAFAYATASEQAADEFHRVVIASGKEYTITADTTIPANTYLDALGKLTIAEGVTVTVPANAKRLAAWTGGTIEGAGKVLIQGRGSLSFGESFVMINGTMSTDMLLVPNGYILGKNTNSYFATEAFFEITYSNGTVVQSGSMSPLTGATKVKLLKNVTDFAFTFGPDNKLSENFVLDLGGYTMSGKADASTQVLSISVPMTIQNGTIRYMSSNGESGALMTSANVTIANNATIDGGVGYAIWTDGYGHTLTVNGTVKSDGSYAITGNGSENGTLIADCSITVNRSAKISAPNGIAIYHPELGTVTVNGGSISGHTGIEMCAGKLIVNGGTITSTGDNYDATGSQNAILDGAAISLINRNYPGGIPSAELKGGTIKATGKNALAVKAYDYSNNTIAKWTDVRKYVEITGGTYSNDVTEYADSGYIVRMDGTAAYTVVRDSRLTEGTYTAEPKSVANGYLVIDNEDGTWTVQRAPEKHPVRRYPANNSGTGTGAATDTDKTVKSSDTGDMGVALYAVTALLSVTGMAWAGKKRGN